MKPEKRDYLPADIEITIFNSADIVTASGGNDWWLGSDGNVDTGGWT
jgi:hypothetical protein